MNKTLIVTDSTFDSEVLQSLRPVLVYFWAEWCDECRYMSPIIEAVAATKLTSLQVAFLNVDENPMHCETLPYTDGSHDDRIHHG